MHGLISSKIYFNQPFFRIRTIQNLYYMLVLLKRYLDTFIYQHDYWFTSI